MDDIAAKTGFMVTEKGERAFQGTFYAARFLLNERDLVFFGEAIAEPKKNKSRAHLYIYKIVAIFDLRPRTTARAFDLQS